MPSFEDLENPGLELGDRESFPADGVTIGKVLQRKPYDGQIFGPSETFG